jgi:dolichol-phosphate mannosyltransferase
MEARATAVRQCAVCILLPVLNERNNVPVLWSAICDVLQDTPFRVCFVDDGSTDGTREWLSALVAQEPQRAHLILRLKRSRGSQRGSALLTAMRWGLGQPDHAWFVEMDGDQSHRCEEMPIGIRLLQSGGADVAIASKYLYGSQVTRRPLGRRLVSVLCNAAVRVLITPRVRDYSNGYRFYSRKAAEVVARSVVHYGSPIYLTETLAMWLSHGLRIVEFPTTYVGRFEGLSKLRITDLIKAGIAVFEISFRYHVLGFASPRRLPRVSVEPVPLSKDGDVRH